VLLDTLGFDAAARALIAELKRTGLRARFRSDASIRLSADASSVLYRALQEALLNVQRHAKASSIDVTLQRAGRDVILKVADDGRGADSDFERKPGAFGLQSVRERLRVLNGSLTLEPVPSGGTRFIARIPDSSGRSPVATT
jgi:signal transduction histidine kinase